ncbi:zinc finger protein 2 homolog, partial [Pseudomyrmex gracilis]|uniref:zinc finger protein 2 homolog n=1 Tax=Pseudomyrmex gracilis TaxID=219809 RepID=UPI00099514F8
MEQQVPIHSSCVEPYKCRKLTVHEIIHLLLRPHKCDKCEKTYKTKQALSRHYQRRHSDSEKPYKCKVCDKRFTTKFEVTNHEAVHSSLRPYECDKCEKTFKTKQTLSRHYQRQHSDSEKPYKCKVCDKRFTTKFEVTNHEAVHSSLRPYECDKCEKTFKTKQTLSRHYQRQHSDSEKPYKCKFKKCNKSFYAKKKLTVHEIIHLLLRPHKCDKCEKPYKTKQALRRQYQRRHSDSEKPYKCK